MDETISYYSKRLQPFKACTLNQDDSSAENYLIDDFIDYYDSEKSTSNKKVRNRSAIIVGRANQFNYYFAMLLKKFAEYRGFDSLLAKATDAMNNLDKENSIDLIQFVFQIFEIALNYFHKLFLLETTEKLFIIGKTFLKAVNDSGVKNVKKDTLDIISRVLKTFNNRSVKIFFTGNKNSGNNVTLNFNYGEVEQLLLSCSVKLIKSGSLDKRIQSIKSLVDYIKYSKDDKEKLEKAFSQIKENNILEEIFGTNSHSQLVIKSQELLGVLMKENKLGNDELSLIWNFAKKADYEGKLTILKILKDLSRFMSSESINCLLSKIFQKSEEQDNLVNEEIEVRFNLTYF